VPRTAPPAPPAVAEPAPAVATPAPPGDLSSYIEARRRARGEVSPAAPQDRPAQGAAPGTARSEDERQRRDRIVAENLGLQRSPTFGFDPKGGGGIFEIEYVGRDSAAFIFFGWNKDIRRNSKQLIEVAKGDNSDIRIAVVRKMIAIIRSEVTGDFTWVSHRLRDNIVLSARPEDNAELEDFMMREFFSDPRRVN
jgi:hypothetical protein